MRRDRPVVLGEFVVKFTQQLGQSTHIPVSRRYPCTTERASVLRLNERDLLDSGRKSGLGVNF